MEAMLNFIPAPVAIVLMLAGFIALAVGGIRLGYKATVKDLALELVEKAELSIMGSGQGAKKKKQVFAALRAKCPAAIRWAITDEVLQVLWRVQEDFLEAALHGVEVEYGGIAPYLERVLRINPAAQQRLSDWYLQGRRQA